MDKNVSLTAKQERFITAYLASNSVSVATLTCKVNEVTGYRWLKLPQVQAALKTAQKRLFEQELTELSRIVGKAIKTLDKNMSGVDVMPSTQVRAAQIVLEQSLALYKYGELEQEIAELRAMVMAQEHDEP